MLSSLLGLLWLLESRMSVLWDRVKTSVHGVATSTPSKKKFNTQPSAGRYTLSFGIGKGSSFWISWKLDKPSTLIATSQCIINHWRLKPPESNQRRRQPFSCSTIMLGPRPAWRPWSTLPVLAEQSYHTYSLDLAHSEFHLFGLMKSYFSSSDSTTAAVTQWVTSTGAGFYHYYF